MSDLNLVYVKMSREHWKEETTWHCDSPAEALRLTKWLISLGLDAQRIDNEVFEAMPERIEGA